MNTTTAADVWTRSAPWVRRLEDRIPVTAVVHWPDCTTTPWVPSAMLVSDWTEPEQLDYRTDPDAVAYRAAYLAAATSRPCLAWYATAASTEPCWLLLPATLVTL